MKRSGSIAGLLSILLGCAVAVFPDPATAGRCGILCVLSKLRGLSWVARSTPRVSSSRSVAKAVTAAQLGAPLFAKADAVAAATHSIPDDVLKAEGLISVRAPRVASLDDLRSAGYTYDHAVNADVALFSAIPTTEQEIREVYGTASLTRRLSLLDGQEQILSAIADNNVHRAVDATADGFVEFLATTDSPIIVVVGHNSDGVFRLPDGSTIPVADMGILCANEQKVCIFLTCRSGDYLKDLGQVSIGRNITPQQAARIAQGLHDHVQQAGDTIEVRALVAETQRLMTVQKLKGQAKLMVVATTSGGAMIIGIYVTGETA